MLAYKLQIYNKNTIFVLLPFPDFILWHWSGL